MPILRRSSSGLRLGAVVGTVALLLLVLLNTAGTYGGMPMVGGSWGSSQVTNSTNAAAAGTLDFTHNYRSLQCQVAGGDTKTCEETIAPTTGAPLTGAVSASTTVTNNGTAPASGVASTFRLGSCAPVGFASKRDLDIYEEMTDTGWWFPRNGVRFRLPDPWHTFGANSKYAFGFDGVDDYVASGRASRPIWTLADYGYRFWFRTDDDSVPLARRRSQAIFSFGTTSDDSQSTSHSMDRTWFIDTNGKVAYAQKGTVLIRSVNALTDGSWYFVHLHHGNSSGATVRLIIGTANGTLIENTSTTLPSGRELDTSNRGYWRMGFAPLTSASYGGVGYSNYFSGAISHLNIWDQRHAYTGAPQSYELTDETYWVKGSAAVRNASVIMDTRESGTEVVTDPGFFPTDWDLKNPCNNVMLKWSTQGIATPFANASLSALSNQNFTVPAPEPGGSLTHTMELSRGTNYVPTSAGAHLLVPITHEVSATQSTSTLRWRARFEWSGSRGIIIS